MVEPVIFDRVVAGMLALKSRHVNSNLFGRKPRHTPGRIRSVSQRPSFITFNMSAETTEAIATTAIGGQYTKDWTQFSRKSWEDYAIRHNLGVIVITQDIIAKDTRGYKNGSWQKLLAPAKIVGEYPQLERICLLDTDILISPTAPNIFGASPRGVFSVVSQLSDLPFPLEVVLRRIAFLRHNFYSSDYPLDSFLLGDPFDSFRDLELPVPPDCFCAGLVVMDTQHADLMARWFYEVKESQNPYGWEENYLNHWIQNEPHHWLPYEYQALWNYEMAWKYPYLYEEGKEIASNEEAKKAVETTLWNNHFLHFAGSWYESEAWKLGGSLFERGTGKATSDLQEFLHHPVEGKKWGQIRPTN